MQSLSRGGAFIIGTKKLFILSLFFLLSSKGLPAATIHLDSATNATEISSSIEVLEDSGGNLTLRDLIYPTHNYLFTPYQINHAYKNLDSVYWARFTVINNSTQNKNWYLTLNNNYVQSLRLFQLSTTPTKDTTAVATGKPEIIKPLSHQNLPTFPLLLSERHTSTYYLRVKFSLTIPQMGLTVYSPDGILKRSNQYSAFYAFIIGAMLIIGIYNLVLFVTLKNPVYASLAISILTLVFMFSNLNGLYAQVTGINTLNAPLYNAMYLLTIAGSLDFLRRVMAAEYYAPLFNKLLLGIQYSALGLLTIIYWIPHADQIINITILLISPVLLIGTIQARRNGRQFASSLFVVVPVYLLTVLPFILASSGILENRASYLLIMHVGILLVMVLLSLTLAERAREVNESKELAQAASEAKSQFLANMSHELRTPMNAVMGFSQLLQQTSLDTEQKDYINKSLGSAKHMLELIDTILDFSKTEVKQLRLEAVNFKLDDLLQMVSTHIEAPCKIKQIEWIVQMDADTPEQVYADPLRLRQVLINLASNAVKFTEHGKITLSVKTIDVKNN